MAEPRGFAFYRDNYTDQQLWDMLVTAGKPVSIGLATSVWATARGKLELTRDSLNTNVADLADYWQGDASSEFQNRMILIGEYSVEVEDRMRRAEERYLPMIAEQLASAQSRAKGENSLGENLDPTADITDPDQWMHEVKGLSHDEIAALEPQQRTTYENEHASWRQARHDELAQTVADLGVQYADMANEHFSEPPKPPPDGMPGNATYQQPTTGVFADSGPNSGGSTGTTVSDTSTSGNTGGGFASVNADDDVAEPWNLPSYDDIDETGGGLASGTPAAPSGPSLSGTTVATGPGAGPGGSAGLLATGGAGAVTGRNGQPLPGRPATTTGNGRAPGGQNLTGRPNPNQTGAGRPGTGQTGGRTGAQQPGTTGRSGPGRTNASGRGGTGAGRGSSTAPAGNRRGDEAEDEETTYRKSKYVEAEDLFTAPFDPAVGPAQEGPKHQREWNKQYDKWKAQRKDED